MSGEYRPIDGVGNNLLHTDWGSAGVQLQRLIAPAYDDALSAPADGYGAWPSAREISNAISAQTGDMLNDRSLSGFAWQWGQFVDHDIDLTEAANPAEPYSVAVPTGDPYFDPFGTGAQTIGLDRSIYDPATGQTTARQQMNEITAYLDGSNIYGSTPERTAALRTFSGGRLKTSEGDLLPYNADHLANAGGDSDTLFLSGDVRANEQVGLTAMHTLFMREHNRLADQIARSQPGLSDEDIFQQARRIVIGEIQSITFNEFLPALLGNGAMGPYTGYNPQVNPGIYNVFSTAVYRFGHSMLPGELWRLGANGQPIDAGNLPLRDAFFAPQQIAATGIDPILRGLASQFSQEIDVKVIDDVRNFLFGPPGAGGFDLAALNIQRGRDHGLPRYNQARLELGLAPANSFADISSDLQTQQARESVYGDVNNVDVWVGALAEDHVAGSSVGELVYTVLIRQFSALREGDRFWYQREFSGRELRQIENTTLADIIRRNTDVHVLQQNVFFVGPPQAGHQFTDIMGRTPGGQWWVAQNDGYEFQNQYYGQWAEEAGWRDVQHADFDGDGLDDVVGRTAGGAWWLGYNTGAGFVSVHIGDWYEAANWQDVRIGDFTGDGLPDILGMTAGGDWWLARNTPGQGLVNQFYGQWSAGVAWQDVMVGDFDHDGLDDVAGRTNDGHWWIGFSDGAGMQNQYAGAWYEAAGWQDVRLGDFDGDGYPDVIGRAANGDWWLAHNENGRFQNVWYGQWDETAGWHNVIVGDFDGDGRDDLIGRTNGGVWWLGHSDGSWLGNQWMALWSEAGNGASEWLDVMLGDFNADGRPDIAGRHAGDGSWWIAMNNGQTLDNIYYGAWAGEIDWRDVEPGRIRTTIDDIMLAQRCNRKPRPRRAMPSTGLSRALRPGISNSDWLFTIA